MRYTLGDAGAGHDCPHAGVLAEVAEGLQAPEVVGSADEPAPERDIAAREAHRTAKDDPVLCRERNGG